MNSKSDTRAPAPDDPVGRGLPATFVERGCMLLGATALMVILVLVGVDIVTRSLFNFSFEIADEVGGYMLVALAFLSLSVCYASGSFHQVEFVQDALSPRGRAVSRLVFGLLVLSVAALFLWQFIRLVMSSWRFGDVAPTYLMTPLWLPRTLMVLGMAALCVTVVRGLAADLKCLWNLSIDSGRSSNGS